MLGKDLGLLGKKHPRWLALVDLFDGSTNFLFDLKYYSYNLAVAKEHRLVFGICIDLENFDVYSAIRGQGAYLNDKKLKGPEEDIDRVICSNVGLENVFYFHYGCSSLELCSLAKGSVDIVIGKSGSLDIAAAYLIASEAGAAIKDWSMKNLRIPIDEKNVEYMGGKETALEEFVRKIGGVKAFKGSIKVKSSIWPSIAKRIH